MILIQMPDMPEANELNIITLLWWIVGVALFVAGALVFRYEQSQRKRLEEKDKIIDGKVEEIKTLNLIIEKWNLSDELSIYKAKEKEMLERERDNLQNVAVLVDRVVKLLEEKK